MTPRSTYQRLLGWGGQCVIALILAFMILPAIVVTIAAFNDKAILSFPPQAWSWRWFGRALAYPPHVVAGTAANQVLALSGQSGEVWASE